MHTNTSVCLGYGKYCSSLTTHMTDCTQQSWHEHIYYTDQGMVRDGVVWPQVSHNALCRWKRIVPIIYTWMQLHRKLWTSHCGHRPWAPGH